MRVSLTPTLSLTLTLTLTLSLTLTLILNLTRTLTLTLTLNLRTLRILIPLCDSTIAVGMLYVCPPLINCLRRRGSNLQMFRAAAAQTTINGCTNI